MYYWELLLISLKGDELSKMDHEFMHPHYLWIRCSSCSSTRSESTVPKYREESGWNSKEDILVFDVLFHYRSTVSKSDGRKVHSFMLTLMLASKSRVPQEIQRALAGIHLCINASSDAADLHFALTSVILWYLAKHALDRLRAKFCALVCKISFCGKICAACRRVQEFSG